MSSFKTSILCKLKISPLLKGFGTDRFDPCHVRGHRCSPNGNFGEAGLPCCLPTGNLFGLCVGPMQGTRSPRWEVLAVWAVRTVILFSRSCYERYFRELSREALNMFAAGELICFLSVYRIAPQWPLCRISIMSENRCRNCKIPRLWTGTAGSGILCKKHRRCDHEHQADTGRTAQRPACGAESEAGNAGRADGSVQIGTVEI